MRALLPSLAGVLAAAAPAAADTIEGMRGERMRLERPSIEARHEPGLVHVTIGYDVVNPERFADEAHLRLDVAYGAVVTGLRYRTGGAWIAGRLLAAEAAGARYDAYASSPFVAARGAAWLAHDGYSGSLSLSYVPPRGRIAIEYDVAIPACFARGHWFVPAPDVLDPAPRPRVRGGQVLDAEQLARAVGGAPEDVCGRFAEDPSSFGGADAYLVFADAPAGVEASMVTVTAASTDVTALEVVTPSVLAPAPRGASVVFVLDASRSMEDDGVEAQLAVVRGYLAHAPDARVEIVVYRRRATRLFGAWIPAAEVPARLAALGPGALATGNGSHLDAGLALAGDLLAGAPGPRRVVAFTDDELRAAIDGPQLAAAMARVPEDAIAHVVIPNGGGTAGVYRDLEHRFAPAAHARGGIVAHVEAGRDPAPYLELVRPVRIEGVRLAYPPRADAPAGTAPTTEDVDPIEEGTGLRQILTGPPPVMTGWIWGTPWAPAARRVRADARVARLVLAARAGELDDAAITALAAIGTAATRLTSFLADDPRWRPGGLPAEDGLGLSGHSAWSTCGCMHGIHGIGRFGTIGHGAGTGTGERLEVPEVGPLLDARVAACAARLEVPWQTRVTVETTGVEIVDVTVATDAPRLPAPARARLDDCVTDAAWDLTLDPRFRRYTTTFAATFGG